MTRCLFPVLLLSACFGRAAETIDDNSVPGSLRTEALAELREVMRTQPRWIKVHAAEALLQLGYPQGVVETFRNELKTAGDQPEYRIGIWRVLARATTDSAGQRQWIDRIRQAFLDENGPDRVHAAETLAKLEAPLSSTDLKAVAQAASSDDSRLATYAQWVLAASDTSNRKLQVDHLHALLDAESPAVRRIAAYAIRYLGQLDSRRWERLANRSAKDPDAIVRLRLYCTALVTAPPTVSAARLSQIKSALLAQRAAQNKSVRCEICSALAERGSQVDLPLLCSYLDDEDPIDEGLGENRPSDSKSVRAHADNADVRTAAAYAIMRIGSKGAMQ